jgi:hypothetical protein
MFDTVTRAYVQVRVSEFAGRRGDGETLTWAPAQWSQEALHGDSTVSLFFEGNPEKKKKVSIVKE